MIVIFLTQNNGPGISDRLLGFYREKTLMILNLALLFIVFQMTHGSERVKDILIKGNNHATKLLSSLRVVHL